MQQAPPPPPEPEPIPEEPEEPEQQDDASVQASDDDELNLLCEELDDGHEDMHEEALLSSIAEGLEYMDSSWVPMDMNQVLDLIVSDVSFVHLQIAAL